MTNRLPKRILYISSVVLTLFIIIYSLFFGDYEQTRFTVDVPPNQPAGFTVDDIFYPAEDFPLTTASERGTTVSIQGTIPDYVNESYSIAFQSLYCACEFFVNGELIKSYGVSSHLPFTSLIGNIYIMVPLNHDMAGQKFTLHMTPYYSVSNMGIQTPIYAPTGELKLSILRKNLPRLLIITMLITIAIIAFALFLAQLVEKSGINLKLFGNFLAMDIFVTLWLICSSDLPQFITNSNDAVSIVSFMCLAIMGVPYMGYCEQVFHTKRKFFLTVQTVGVIIPALNVLCCLFGICDPMTLLPLTHLYMVVVMLSSLIVAVTESNKTIETWFLISGVALLFISAIGGLIFYYILPASGFDGIFFGLGFICFITSLFLLILSRQVTMIKERRHLDTYKTMAYNDLLTNLGNRSAFENCFESMGSRVTNGEPVTLIMFDLNGLKATNDTYGHQAGDEMISTMAHMLERHFIRYGSCYRLGGDEYAVIIERTYLDFKTLCESFKASLAEVKLNSGASLSSSIGYATLPYNGKEEFRDVIYSKADEAMYTEKKKYHLEHERRKG